MGFIVILLGLLAIGSLIWTIIQIVRPELFFKAEETETSFLVSVGWHFRIGCSGNFMDSGISFALALCMDTNYCFYFRITKGVWNCIFL